MYSWMLSADHCSLQNDRLKAHIAKRHAEPRPEEATSSISDSDAGAGPSSSGQAGGQSSADGHAPEQVTSIQIMCQCQY